MREENSVRELTLDELEMVSGGSAMQTIKRIKDETPDEVLLIGAIGTGMMFGAVGGPLGAVAGGIAGGLGYLFF